jgi:hypothetical protein
METIRYIISQFDFYFFLTTSYEEKKKLRSSFIMHVEKLLIILPVNIKVF